MTMDMSTVLALVMMMFGVLALLMSKGHPKKDSIFTGGSIIIVVGMLVLIGGSAGYFTVGGADVITPADDMNDIAPDVPVIQPMTTVTYTVIDGISNSRTTSSGTVEFYASNVDPTNPTAVYNDAITIASGTGNTTTLKLLTDTIYNAVFSGGASYYDVDMGTKLFPYIKNVATQRYSGEITTTAVATIADPVDETDTTDYFSTYNNGSGSTTYNADGCLSATGSTITYNTTTGSDGFVIPLTVSITGGNQEIKDAALIFKWDTTNPPNGDEYTSIIAQPITGQTFSALEGDLINYWSTQTPIPLGDLKAGTYAKYNLVFTCVDANIDANDDWDYILDDMGDHLGQDIMLNTKASAQVENVDHEA